jgi:hypothetical protein
MCSRRALAGSITYQFCESAAEIDSNYHNRRMRLAAMSFSRDVIAAFSCSFWHIRHPHDIVVTKIRLLDHTVANGDTFVQR